MAIPRPARSCLLLAKARILPSGIAFLHLAAELFGPHLLAYA
jgi:hypothetical protein